MSYQIVMILGRLGRDPELRFTQAGVGIAKAPIATTRIYFDNESNKHEETEWHNVTVFGKKAETFNKYLKKGHMVFIEGRNKTSTYEKDGQKHYRTEVVVEDFKLVGTKELSTDGEQKPKQKTKSQPKSVKKQSESPPDDNDWTPSDEPQDTSVENTDDIPF